MTTPIALRNHKTPCEQYEGAGPAVLTTGDVDEAVALLEHLIEGRRQAILEIRERRPRYENTVVKSLLATNKHLSAVAVLEKTRDLLIEFRKIASVGPAASSWRNVIY